jgi:Flp pilus assembly protein TadG
MCFSTERGMSAQDTRSILRSQRGQGTVEAAFLLPILFLLLLMLCQPMILL